MTGLPAEQSRAKAPKGVYSASEESHLLLSLYSDVGSANFWQGFMHRLAGLVDVNAGVVAVINIQSAEMKAAWCWNLDIETLGKYITGGFAAKDDLINHCLAAEPKQFYSAGLHLAPILDYEIDSDVYKEWVAPQGINEVAMAIPTRDGNWITFFTLYRTADQGHFSADQLKQFSRLVPHVERALDLHRDLIQNRGRPEEIESWLSLVKVPVLLLDEKFNCCVHNAAAKQFFASQQVVRLENDSLEFDDPVAARQVGFHSIRAVQESMGEAKAELKILQLLLDNQLPTTFVFMPLEEQLESPLAAAGALIFIYQSEFTQALNFEPLQALFGLTTAELKVCSLLARGLSVQDIADKQSKSKETVRSQLKQVFSKTGTGSQAELVLSLLTHPTVLAGNSPPPLPLPKQLHTPRE